MMVQSLRSFSLNEKICLKYSSLSMIHVLINCLGFAECYRKEFSLYSFLFAHIKHQQQILSIPPLTSLHTPSPPRQTLACLGSHTRGFQSCEPPT